MNEYILIVKKTSHLYVYRIKEEHLSTCFLYSWEANFLVHFYACHVYKIHTCALLRQLSLKHKWYHRTVTVL